jgi:hypothetical protein
MVSLNFRSLSICSFAKPTFTRSRYATMYDTNSKGISRHVTFE